jgi:predicted thioesterase
LQVRASDDAQEIGRGTNTRAVISVGKFMAKFQGGRQ